MSSLSRLLIFAENLEDFLYKQLKFNNMKQCLLVITLLFITGFHSIAQTELAIKDADLEGNKTYNWTKDNVYVLDGFVFLEEGGVLNIEAGTVIKAKGRAEVTTGDRTSALIIARGGKINAVGTASAPIIFTSTQDDVNDDTDLGLNDRGLWGGLIILGNGKIAENSGEDLIEGLPSSESRAFYGGNNNNEDSGILNYVSIRHGGDELEQDKEINGLTLAGVGSATKIDFVEVVSNLDDGIEIFGGAVNVKHAVIAYCGDECFDYDESWAGRGQFWFALIGMDRGDQAGEHDGSEADDENDFTSVPKIYNATYIGPGEENVDVKAPRVLHFKSRGTGIYGNSIFTGFAKAGLQVEDKPAGEGADSYSLMKEGKLKVLNTIWYSEGWKDVDDIIQIDENAENLEATELKEAFGGEWANTIENPFLSKIGRGSFQYITKILGDNDLNPLPQLGGAAYSNLVAIPSENDGDVQFFEAVDYKGAFGQDNWAMGWTALHSLKFFDDGTTGINTIDQITQINLSPNPATNRTTLNFELEDNLDMTVGIFDQAGKLIRVIGTERFLMGWNELSIQVDGLNAGIYFVRLQNENKNVSLKLLVK